MLSRTCCFALQGVEGVPVTVEAYVSGGQFAFTMVGLPDAAVRESRERVYAAMKNNGFTTPSGHVTVNLSPADLRKEGTAFDLPIAVAIIIATRQIRAVDATSCCWENWPWTVGWCPFAGRCRWCCLPMSMASAR